MMQVRCQRCGWVFTMSRDSIGLAVAEAEADQAEHYLVDCPKCRHGIKVRVAELRKRLPADYVLPALLPKPAPIHVDKDGEKRAESKAAPTPPIETPDPEAKPRRATKPKPAAEAKPKAESKPKSTSKPAAKKK